MSAESLDEKSRSLSVEIPSAYLDPASSVESSSNPSPTGILGSRSTSASSSSLPTQLLNVTFAPLPELAPRKRRSTAPLGMAARGQLMRRRRYVEQAYANNPMWTDEELAEQQQAAIQERRRQEEEDEAEDPFLVLGKMVKVASKNIWRKVSQKDLSKKRKKDEEEDKKATTVAERNADIHPDVPTEPRAVLATITQNGDPLVTEAEEEERFLTVGQTETIVEGHTKYSWVNGSLDSSERTPTAGDDDNVAAAQKNDPPTRRSAST